jgi:hypothetical protein
MSQLHSQLCCCINSSRVLTRAVCRHFLNGSAAPGFWDRRRCRHISEKLAAFAVRWHQRFYFVNKKADFPEAAISVYYLFV